jgi:AraC-like DNA-binding protein
MRFARCRFGCYVLATGFIKGIFTEPMSLQLIYFSLDVMAVLTALLFGVRLLLTSPEQLNARFLALICLNTICAIALSRQELAYWIPEAYRIDVGVLRFPMHLARNLTPGFLMLLCFSLFQDEAKFPRWLSGAFALQIVLEILSWWLVPPSSASQYSAVRLIPAVLELTFVALALYWVLNGWRTDLVEARRQLRGVFLTILGMFIFLVVLLERLVIPWDSDGTLYTHIASSILIIVFFNAAYLTVGRWSTPAYVDPFRDEKEKEPVVEPASAPLDQHDAAVALILKAFREQRVYHDGELTIASLAAKLSMPEYRVRKLIHEQLGYRNFNALLHEYRIAEACRDLGDAAKDHLPILTIALTVGYNSINPFNRAFREAKGMTPSVFRSQRRDDAIKDRTDL